MQHLFFPPIFFHVFWRKIPGFLNGKRDPQKPAKNNKGTPNFLITIPFLLIIPKDARARVRTRTRVRARTICSCSAAPRRQPLLVLALTLTLVLTLARAPSGMINKKGMIIKKFGVLLLLLLVKIYRKFIQIWII